MRNPRDFGKPLALGAPDAAAARFPLKPSRVIHFFDPSNPKMAAKVPEMARQADILLGNLEDAIPADKKIEAREGLVQVGREVDLGDTPLWTRVNSLDSPWFLDDIMRLVGEIGDRLEVIMIPKVEGPWDIHYVDRLLAQLEARAQAAAADPGARHSRDRARRHQRRGDLRRQPAHAGHQLRPGRSRGVAAHEDDARRRRPSRPTWCATIPTAPTPTRRGRPRSRIPGTTRSPAWSMPAPPPARCRSTARSATSPIRSAARISSAPRSCSAASAPGRCTRARSPSPRRSSARRSTRSLFAKRVLEAMPDGRGVLMLDGKMQDDATWKQCKVMVNLAKLLAAKDKELAAAYGF